jgi:hypothetical protein
MLRRDHIENDELLEKCPDCGVTFTRSDALKRHIGTFRKRSPSAHIKWGQAWMIRQMAKQRLYGNALSPTGALRGVSDRIVSDARPQNAVLDTALPQASILSPPAPLIKPAEADGIESHPRTQATPISELPDTNLKLLIQAMDIILDLEPPQLSEGNDSPCPSDPLQNLDPPEEKSLPLRLRKNKGKLMKGEMVIDVVSHHSVALPFSTFHFHSWLFLVPDILAPRIPCL